MVNKTYQLDDAIYEWLLNLSLNEEKILQDLRLKTQSIPEYGMQISPEQGQFMRLLVELIGAKKTLEIGTFTGYSSLCIALSLPDDGKVYTCDINETWATLAREYWNLAGVSSKIVLKIGLAEKSLQEYLDNGEQETFDFSFIDADKINYDAYYEKSLELIRKGGLIAIDNVFWKGEVINPENQEPETKAIRKIVEKVKKDSRVSSSLVPIGDGLLLARKI